MVGHKEGQFRQLNWSVFFAGPALATHALVFVSKCAGNNSISKKNGQRDPEIRKNNLQRQVLPVHLE